MIICNQCGMSVSLGEQFCHECGAAVLHFFAEQNPTPAPLAQSELAAREFVATTPLSSAPYQIKPVRSSSMLLWVLISAGVLAIFAIVVVAIQLSTSSSRLASAEDRSLQTAKPAGTPFRYLRVVRSRFDGVNVRNAPSLSGDLIAVINQGHLIKVISESSNFDTVRIQSLNSDVTDNWSEVQIDNTAYGSIRGWIFSGFLR